MLTARRQQARSHRFDGLTRPALLMKPNDCLIGSTRDRGKLKLMLACLSSRQAVPVGLKSGVASVDQDDEVLVRVRSARTSENGAGSTGGAN
jgi:hypothetical protein